MWVALAATDREATPEEEMRKRVTLLLVAALVAVGLSAVVQQSAGAYPTTGTHTIQVRCEKGTVMDHTVRVDYSLTHTGTSSGGERAYSWQMNRAEFSGTPAPHPNAGVHARLSRKHYMPGSASVSMMNATGAELSQAGGANLFSAPMPDTTLTGPVVRQNGVNGINWTPVALYKAPTDREPYLFLSWDTGTSYPCEFWIYLDKPNAPIAGAAQFGTMSCTATSQPAAIGNATVDINYELIYVGFTETYQFELNDVVLDSQASVSQDYWATHQFDLVTSSGTHALTPPGGLASQNRDGETHWTKTAFNDTQFEWFNGQATPYIRWTATADGGAQPQTCEKRWYIGETFGVPGHTYTNTAVYEFDDCTGATVTSNVTINSTWELDGNMERVRARQVQVINNSSAQLRLSPYIAGSSAQRNAWYRSDASGANISYSHMTSNATDGTSRYWTGFTTKDMPITRYGGWVTTNPQVENPFPLYFDRQATEIPVFDLSFSAWVPNGSGGWTWCNTGTQLDRLEATSLFP
jgi:hypothetical protein